MIKIDLKTLWISKDSRNNLLLCLLLLFPLLPIKVIGFIGVVLSLFSILNNRKNNFKINLDKDFYLSIIYYLLMIVSLIYSSNIKEGLNEVLKTLLLILFPCSLILFIKSELLKDKLLFYFVLINVIFCFYLYNTAIEILAYKKMTFLNEANFLTRLKTFITTPYNVPYNWSSRNFKVSLFFHKAYVSSSLCLSAIIAFYFFLNKNYIKKRLLFKMILFCSFIITSFFVFYLQSIPNIVVYLFCISYLIFKKVSKNKMHIGLFLLVIFFGFFSQINKINSLYNQLEFKIEKDFRNQLWKCGCEVIKDNFFLGTGIGDQESEMLSCYDKQNNEVFVKASLGKMNSHNQFISFFILGGAVVFICFLFLIINNLFIAIKHGDILFFLFLIIILVNFLFENFLDRIYGIYFFSFFNSFFIKRNKIFRV